MGAINKLSKQEKERRPSLLADYDHWAAQMNRPTVKGYEIETGSDAHDVSRCLRWRQSYYYYHSTKTKSSPLAQFVKISPAPLVAEAPVKLLIGPVLIEVGATSSKKALSIIRV
jgi:hypothetical protein